MTIFIGLVPPFLSTLQWGKTSIPASSNEREEVIVKIPITVTLILNILSSCESPVGNTRVGDPTTSTVTVVRGGQWPAGSLIVDWVLLCK